MSWQHKTLLCGALLFLAASLVYPGLMGALSPATGTRWLMAEDLDALNHLRALNGMMVAVGLIAVWACLDLPHARTLVLALGLLMSTLVCSRIYSIIVDGMPGIMNVVYLCIELLLATLFLLWPPPK